HTFFNDKGFHNHCSHHLLAAYSLGAPPALLQDILELHRETASVSDAVPSIRGIINESNWTEYLGDERYYPNYLAFFHRLISTPPASSSPYADKPTSVVPVVEQYLFGGEGQMLVRAVSGALHPLIHIGHGIEFGLDGHVAEGLAQCAVHDPRTTGLPYFHSMTIASPDRSFARTAANLPRQPGSRRYPREGLSGFTILSRILQDEALAPGQANSLDDASKLDACVRNRASRIRQWCEEWRFSTEERIDMAAPPWDEIVEKCEELVWMATVIYAAAARPGYQNVKLDFFTMHGLTSVLFLPSMLEVLSPHLRPYLLMSHFRLVVAYWVSRGRPDLKEDANAADGGEDPYTNPWLKVLQSAIDHDDEHVTKVVRSLYWAATQFGASPRGMFTSSLPGSEDMDGTIFIRGELGRPTILFSFFFPRETRLITRG
ncbi:hypothetical protein RHOSPDRAFT_20535, partial [Rhodotorula sp. JG-1b]